MAPLSVLKGEQAQQECPEAKGSKAGEDRKDGQRHPSAATKPGLAPDCPHRTDFPLSTSYVRFLRSTQKVRGRKCHPP